MCQSGGDSQAHSCVTALATPVPESPARKKVSLPRELCSMCPKHPLPSPQETHLAVLQPYRPSKSNRLCCPSWTEWPRALENQRVFRNWMEQDSPALSQAKSNTYPTGGLQAPTKAEGMLGAEAHLLSEKIQDVHTINSKFT